MTIPYPIDPSLPSNPSPLFSDTTAARGDHLRANNAQIWADINYLEALAYSGKVNLVYNGNFSSSDVGLWSNGDNAHPDGWVIENPDASVVSLSKNIDGSAKITVGVIDTFYRFQQNIHEFPGWGKYLKGKKVTVCFNVKTSSTTALLKVYDGVNTAQQVVSGAAVGKEFLLTLQVSENATCLRVIVEMVTSHDEVNIISIGANLGELYVYDQPCIIQGKIGELKSYDATEVVPAGEFRVYSMELPAGYTRLDSFINGKFGRGGNGRSKLDDAPGRYDRNWANGSANDPDRASRSDRGDGATGDHVGTKLGWQNSLHAHITPAYSGADGSTAIHNSNDVLSTGSRYAQALYNLSSGNSGGNQANPIDRNILKTIRWC